MTNEQPSTPTPEESEESIGEPMPESSTSTQEKESPSAHEETFSQNTEEPALTIEPPPKTSNDDDRPPDTAVRAPLPRKPEEIENEEPPEETHVDFDLLDIDDRWLLKVLSGPNTGAEFSIHAGSSYLIGTDTHACDIIFQDLSVSRKHAKLTVDAKDAAILEDLKSRNGTFVDGEKIERKSVSGNVLVSMGTTTFMLIDREAERTTIVTGILGPGREGKGQIGTSQEGGTKSKEGLVAIQKAVMAPLQSEIDRVKEEEKLQAKLSHAVSSLIILAVVTGLIMTIGIGGALLFRTETVVSPTPVNPDAEILKALKGFPAIRFSYNPTNKRLLLVGHVLTTIDRSRMLDVLQQLKFIRDIDYNNVVIDERVWREFNQILAKNPAWRSISITSPSAGRYILSGFLQTRAQAEELFDYISQNFAYVDLLERRVVVEEELLGQISRELGESGFRGVTPALKGSDLILTGSINKGSSDRFQKLLTVFRALPGIRSIQVLVSEAGQKEAVVDISSKYAVTGYSTNGTKISVVINGRILEPGDALDGMLITEITATTVYLEKGTVRYKIDFNQ